MKFKLIKYAFMLMLCGVTTSAAIAGQPTSNINELYAYMDYKEMFKQDIILQDPKFSDVLISEGLAQATSEFNTSHQPAISPLHMERSLPEPNRTYLQNSSGPCCFDFSQRLFSDSSEEYVPISTSEILDEELIKLFKKNKKSAMKNAIYMPCLGCLAPIACFAGVIPFIGGVTSLGGGIAVANVIGIASGGLQTIGSYTYRIYCAPQTDPINLYEEMYARRKRFHQKSLQDAIEIKFAAFRKSTMGETAIIDYCKTALNLPVSSKEIDPNYSAIISYLAGYQFASYNGEITAAITHHDANYSAKFGVNSKDKNIIFLEGEPGLGKTKMVEEIARFMNLPLIKVDLGSADQARILGTPTEPGLLLEAISKVAERNAILFLDEMDRVVNDPQCINLLASLLPFFEPSTKYISSSYLGAEIDISHYLIIGAGNSKITDRALANRINVVTIEGIDTPMKQRILREKLPALLSSNKIKFHLTMRNSTLEVQEDSALSMEEELQLQNIIEEEDADHGYRSVQKKLSHSIGQIRLKRIHAVSAIH